jgi:hypothetical protein
LNSKQENTKQNFKFRSEKDSIVMNVFCIVIECFTWSDSVVDFSCEPASVWCARSLVGFVQSERLDEEDNKKTKTQNPKKKKKKKRKRKADQKENPVVGGYFIVLITAGSIQRVLNRLFL